MSISDKIKKMMTSKDDIEKMGRFLLEEPKTLFLKQMNKYEFI